MCCGKCHPRLVKRLKTNKGTLPGSFLYFVTVCTPRFAASTFSAFLFFFFFFFLRVNSNLTWVYCSCTVHVLKNIKNRSHDTIYIFKNYFATVFSVFSNNKLNPNGPFIKICMMLRSFD